MILIDKITQSNLQPSLYPCLILYPIITIKPSIGNTIFDYTFIKANNIFDLDLKA